MLIPGTDASLLAISRGREQVEPYVKVGLPAPEIVERSLSKVALGEARGEGRDPGSRERRSRRARGRTPSREAIRLSRDVEVGRHGVHRDGELRRLGSAVVHDEPSLERLLPDYGDSWLVQRVQPGALLSFAGVIGGGRLLSQAVSRYRRTWPPEAGSVAFSETITPPAGLSERAHALVAAMGWEGIFELELLEGSGDSWSTLDMNPRVYGSLALADRAGAPLPVVWCDWLLGRRFAATAAQPGYRYRWDDAEIRRLGWLVGHRQVGSIPDLIRPRPRTVRAHLWRSDPLPLAARVLALLHHRGARLRRPRALPRAAPAVTGYASRVGTGGGGDRRGRPVRALLRGVPARCRGGGTGLRRADGLLASAHAPWDAPALPLAVVSHSGPWTSAVSRCIRGRAGRQPSRAHRDRGFHRVRPVVPAAGRA